MWLTRQTTLTWGRIEDPVFLESAYVSWQATYVLLSQMEMICLTAIKIRKIDCQAMFKFAIKEDPMETTGII